MAAAPEFEVSHGHSLGYTWNIFKDNPAGNKVLYLRWPNGNSGSGLAPAELWHASPTGGNRTFITNDVGLADNHTNSWQQWINNNTIVYTRRAAADPSTWITRVADLNGNILRSFPTEPGFRAIYYHDGSGKVVGSFGGNTGSSTGPLANVKLLDPFSGGVTPVLDTSAFEPWKANWTSLGGSANPQRWTVFHTYLNPAGTRIWLKMRVHNDSGVAVAEFAFSFNTSGGDIVFYNHDVNGAHNVWWDNNRIFHSHGFNPTEIRNRNGSLSEAAPISGGANHPGLSPDRLFIAADSRSSSTTSNNVKLYAKGSSTALTTLYQTSFTGIVKNGEAHLMPSFSRDGTKVYVNKPVSESAARLMMYDISEWAGGAQTEIIIDNTSAEYSGTWSSSTFQPNFWATDYRSHASGGTGSNWVKWRASIPSAGNYAVYYWLPNGKSDRASNARFTVWHDSQSTTYLVDQRQTGGSWKLLGTHFMTISSTGNGVVVLTDEGDNAYVVADAIKFVKQ